MNEYPFLLTDALCRPVAFVLTGGRVAAQVADCTAAADDPDSRWLAPAFIAATTRLGRSTHNALEMSAGLLRPADSRNQNSGSIGTPNPIQSVRMTL